MSKMPNPEEQHEAIESTKKQPKMLSAVEELAKSGLKGQVERQTVVQALKEDIPQTDFAKGVEGKLQNIEEETTQLDKTHLSGSTIEDIRKGRVLIPKKSSELPEEYIKKHQQEYLRRYKAYSHPAENGARILDYKQMGSDKHGKSHEMNIGLGELLPEGIKNIKVTKTSGEIVIGYRTVISTNPHKGRIGYADENGKYIATFTGDKVQILSGDENTYTDITENQSGYAELVMPKYQRLQSEDQQRESSTKEWQEEVQARNEEPLLMLDDIDTNTELEINDIDKAESVIPFIKFKMSSSQLSMAKIIEEEFHKAGLPNRIIAAAITNSWAESRLNPTIKAGGSEDSWGLFQVNVYARRNRFDGDQDAIDKFREDMKNPRKNCQEILKHEVLAGRGARLRAAAASGASISELANIFCKDIERPAKKEQRGKERASLAKRMYQSTNESTHITKDRIKGTFAIERDGRAPWKMEVDLKSNQETWILGSSTAAQFLHMKETAEKNIGICGIAGIGPEGFYKNFTKLLAKIEKNDIKLPKKVVLVGMALNSTHSPENVISAYKKIAQLFEKKGVKVVFSTIQPATNSGLPERSRAFNDLLKRSFPSHQVLDTTKSVTSEDIASDGIHMTKEARGRVLAMIDKIG